MAEHGEPLDLAHRLVRHCAHLLSASAAALLVEGADGSPEVLAATDGRARVLELFQLRDEQGPCLDGFRSGRPTTSPDLADLRRRWPRFAEQAERAGVVAAHSFPLVVGERTIGTLNVFRDAPGALTRVEADVARSLAAFGAVGITQLQDVAAGRRLQEQLQEALDSRVVIEQAKGVLAERHGVPPDEAFARLRALARGRRRRLREVAQEVVDEVAAAGGGRSPVPSP
nr:GAF and ANTAR domain-containing protein [Kineococcus vitellinus]